MVTFDPNKILKTEYICFAKAMVEEWCISNCEGTYRIIENTDSNPAIKIDFDNEYDEVAFMVGALY